MNGEIQNPVGADGSGFVDAIPDHVENVVLFSRRRFLGLADGEVMETEFSVSEKSMVLLGKAIGAIAAAGLIAVPIKYEDAQVSHCMVTDIACLLQEDGYGVPETMRLGPLSSSSEMTIGDTLTTTTGTVPSTSAEVPPTTTSSVVQPAQEVVFVAAEQPPVNPEVLPPSPEIIAAFEAMRLNEEGYARFFTTINQTWFDHAQGYVNFNPRLVSDPAHAGENAIPQQATEWITPHFTASYSNAPESGTNAEPIGEMQVGRLIDFLGNARGVPCCGVNFIIDRHGGVFQTAPFQAKLRHNPPYDGRTTGFEIEAMYERQITAAQLESAAYLTIAMLANENLLGTKPLRELYRGHGEMRDAHRAHSGDRRWDIRNDFDQPTMDIFRAKLDEFLSNSPNILQLTQPLR